MSYLDLLFKGEEQRRRMKLPREILIIGVLFIFAPGFNLFFTAFYLHERIWNTISRFDSTGLLLLLVQPIVGIALLRVKRWSWFLFVGYSLVLSAYNFYLSVVTSSDYNRSVFFLGILMLFVAAFLIHRNYSAPYIAVIDRGFRRTRRKPLKKKLRINDTEVETVDVSSRGMLVTWPDCNLFPGTEVRVEHHATGKIVPGGIVRMEDGQVGIAYRNKFAGEHSAY